jgi:hypothetical protein
MVKKTGDLNLLRDRSQSHLLGLLICLIGVASFVTHDKDESWKQQSNC